MKSPVCHPGRNLAWGLATSLPEFWGVPRQPPSPTVRKPFYSFLSSFSILLLSSWQGATLVISHIKVLPIFYSKCAVAPRTFRSHSFGQFSQDVNSRPLAPSLLPADRFQLSIPLSNEATGDEAALHVADPEYTKTMNPQLWPFTSSKKNPSLGTFVCFLLLYLFPVPKTISDTWQAFKKYLWRNALCLFRFSGEEVSCWVS